MQGFVRALGAVFLFAMFIIAARPALAAMPVGVDRLCDNNRPADREPAKGMHRPAPVYPQADFDAESEGWALFLYTIATDGSTKDIVTLDRMGSAGFVTRTIETMKTWRYRPSMLNGQPVEQYGNQMVMTFLFEETNGGERKSHNESFAPYFNRAQSDLRDGRNADAISELNRAFQLKLDLYEEAMASYLIAFASNGAGAKNWHDALVHIRHAVVGDLTYLNADVKGVAVDLDVALEAQDGNYRGALCSYLRAVKANLRLAPATVQLAEKIGTLIADPVPLVIPAEVFASALGDAPAALPNAWLHPLLRSKFSFSGVKGNVKNLRLVCASTVLEAPVNEETQWSVPANAGYCRLFVFADPGTTFQLIEGGG